MSHELKTQLAHCLEQAEVENRLIAAWDQDAYLDAAEQQRRTRVMLRRDLWQRIADEISEHLERKDADVAAAAQDEVLFP